MKEIILVGGGGHCKSVIDVIESEGQFKIAGIIDNNLKIGDNVLNYYVIGNDFDLENLRQKYKYAFITVGHMKNFNIRIELFNKLTKLKYNIPIIISPFAYVSKYTQIGTGTIIMHKAFVNANVQIGRNCIINSGAIVEHDCKIEDFCHISTGAIVNGGVVVKERTFFGSNATSKECIKIEGFIKAGSVIK